MKVLSDLLAVILFFLAYTFTKDIFIATAVAIVIGVIQAAIMWWKHKKLDTMQWVGLVLIVVLGGATILFQNDSFIKWKPTALFWFGALALLIGHLLKKNALKSMMGKEIQLPEQVWQRLTLIWIVFLAFMGIANITVAYTFSQEFWVNYKLFGSTALLFLFILGQGVYLSRYLSQEDAQ